MILSNVYIYRKFEYFGQSGAFHRCIYNLLIIRLLFRRCMCLRISMVLLTLTIAASMNASCRPLTGSPHRCLNTVSTLHLRRTTNTLNRSEDPNDPSKIHLLRVASNLRPLRSKSNKSINAEG